MQRNKRLMKLQRAEQRRKQNARRRKQQATGRKASNKRPGARLLDVTCCTKKLKSGKRCSRTAEKKINGKWRCWQHAK